MATELRDSKLLAKLSAGDMTATDSIYHKNCFIAFYTLHRTFVRKSSHQLMLESIALAELVSYIENYSQLGGDLNHIFK